LLRPTYRYSPPSDNRYTPAFGITFGRSEGFTGAIASSASSLGFRAATWVRNSVSMLSNVGADRNATRAAKRQPAVAFPCRATCYTLAWAASSAGRYWRDPLQRASGVCLGRGKRATLTDPNVRPGSSACAHLRGGAAPDDGRERQPSTWSDGFSRRPRGKPRARHRRGQGSARGAAPDTATDNADKSLRRHTRIT
jgi:hypothetical protein